MVVAEGACEKGRDFVTVGSSEKNREARLGGVGAVVAEEIRKRTGKETRVCVLGHLQRGGAPTRFDRLLCTRFGARAVQIIADGKYGQMVALRPPDTVAVKLSDAIGRLRAVPWTATWSKQLGRWGSVSVSRRRRTGNQPFGFNCGNRITSRMLSWPRSIMHRRSMPMPMPPAGGMPCSSATRKSSSSFCCSPPA